MLQSMGIDLVQHKLVKVSVFALVTVALLIGMALVPAETAHAASYYCYQPSKVSWKDGHNYVSGWVPRNLVNGKPWKLWPATWLRALIGGPFDPWFIRSDGYYEAGFHWSDKRWMQWVIPKDFSFCREV